MFFRKKMFRLDIDKPGRAWRRRDLSSVVAPR
jgi:hypothetical protein